MCDCFPLTTDHRIENLGNNWAAAKVSFLHSDGTPETRYEILDMRSGAPHTRYGHEPWVLVALKCFLLTTVGIPLYSLAYIGYHLIRLPLVTLATLSPRVFLNQIKTIVRAPFYLIGMEFAAIYGIFRPFEGRALLGDLTVRLHNKSHLYMVGNARLLPEIGELIWEALTHENPRYAFAVDPCMAPIGKTNDPHITRWEIVHPG